MNQIKDQLLQTYKGRLVKFLGHDSSSVNKFNEFEKKNNIKKILDYLNKNGLS